MRIGELFSGYGGLGMGVQSVLGGTVAWHSEIDPGACKILAHRYPDVPNLGDITAVDWTQVEPVDVLTGGFPCQDVSSAGKRAGLNDDTRSGLWAQMARAIDELRPPLVVAENVRGLLSACALSELEPCPRCLGDESQPHRPVLRALGRVLGDLADLGYDARWCGLRAADVGAPHGRFRVFVVAWPATDTGSVRGIEGWIATPGQTAGGRPLGLLAGRGGAHAPHPAGPGLEGRRPGGSPAERPGSAAAHPPRDGRHEGRTEPARVVGGSHVAVCGDDPRKCISCGWCADFAPDADSDGREVVERGEPRLGARRDPDGRGQVAWGAYEPAVRRWEHLTRPAPSPTERGKNGQPRLSPAFVEWLMGLPAGWVTDVPGITRNEALKALGNGVVPQQAAEALRRLLNVQEAAA